MMARTQLPNLALPRSATCPDLLDIDAIQGTERPRGREEPDTVANCEELSSDVLRVALHSSHRL